MSFVYQPLFHDDFVHFYHIFLKCVFVITTSFYDFHFFCLVPLPLSHFLVLFWDTKYEHFHFLLCSIFNIVFFPFFWAVNSRRWCSLLYDFLLILKGMLRFIIHFILPNDCHAPLIYDPIFIFKSYLVIFPGLLTKLIEEKIDGKNFIDRERL